MGLFKAAVQALTEPKERGGVIMWDCPLCPALFWSQARADAHIAQCRGE